MMRRLFQLGSVLAALLLAASLACAAPPRGGFHGQRGQGPRMQRQQQRQMQRAQQRAGRPPGKPNARALMGLPPKWIENLRDRSPEEQERFMRNNARFRSLPPERQEQIRRNLERWNQLTPQQREAMRNRELMLERMTPAERQEVVNDLAPRWKNLPQDRKQILTGRLRVLGGMSPEEREQKLQDPQFMQGLDANEQDLLRKLSNLRLGPNPGGQ
ncbi:MAG TPA: DUF3106 domain-containing protein [Candidatus Acidoferrales bacterium]|nr:DUF3106 domain-containing protein [Candidatus Acidoferrales bacterium]